ncbi:MAG: hypothetical protein ABMA15_14225 [Vicinamibacterales bacterium]
MKRAFSIGALALSVATLHAQPTTIADFYDRFTAEWVRSNPDQAVSTRYFSGAEPSWLASTKRSPKDGGSRRRA